MARYTISLVAGDGIGPELAHSANLLLESIGSNSNVKFDIQNIDAGDEVKTKFGKALPDHALDLIKKSDACLKAPVGESAADVVLVLRQTMDLYANVRPVKSFPNLEGLSDTIDMVIVRENTEDLYLGWEFEVDKNTVISMRRTSERASRRIAEYAFRVSSQRNGKKKVVAVHKANVLRRGDGLFARTCRIVSNGFPNIAFTEQYVDACAMNLIRNPEDYDVILTTNMFGDILSDEAIQVAGGIGMGPTCNIGDNFALFEPIHGAAFDLAGKNVANPSSILLSCKLMLEWLGEKNGDTAAIEEAQKIEHSIRKLLVSNQKTIDIGGELSTSGFTKAVIGQMY
ncbi:MAG: leuB [Nitrososphaeraceae archaeon]|nr:leuB [Nitrososphaeraceae archaeon]